MIPRACVQLPSPPAHHPALRARKCRCALSPKRMCMRARASRFGQAPHLPAELGGHGTERSPWPSFDARMGFGRLQEDLPPSSVLLYHRILSVWLAHSIERIFISVLSVVMPRARHVPVVCR